jgi:class 3 adenylate cyclase/tetratricopeptide (TPR) repeat protein
MSEWAPSGEAQTAGEGRRRHVTILFADLCDYTALNEAIDPEDADSLRRQIEAVAMRMIRKHGGTVSQVYGDGILAVFGFPTPQEDDARRAVEAALEVHQATRATSWGPAVPSGFEVRMHSAIHAGLVFAREGDALHGQYELTGDAVNTTARLCNAAARDEILVSDAVLSGIEAFFATQSAPPIALKGKKVPVRAHRVTGRSDVRTRFEARTRDGLTAFVGREAELARLELLLAKARAGAPCMALVSGAPGVGKTRILEELRRRIASSGSRVLRGSCESYGKMPPLEPFIQELRQLFGIHATMPAQDAVLAVHEGIERLGAPVREHEDILLQLLSLRPWPVERPRAETERVPVVRALAQLVLTLGACESLVLILDDWQWADDTSREVLAQVLREITGQRICILVCMRAGERMDPVLDAAEKFPLHPFSEMESAGMIGMLRPRILDLGVARAIHRRSGGNPLFLEELCRSLPDGVLAGERALEESGVPTTLQGLIQARVSGLPLGLSQLLRVASVIGNEFSLALLSQVLPSEDVGGLLDELLRGDLFNTTDLHDTFRFKHGITREVIYESVRMAERRELHRAIALAIERSVAAGQATDQYEVLAYHYRGSADHESAATYAELAGDKAMVTSSLDRARFQYSTALSELDKLPPTLERKRRWLGISPKWAGVYVYSPSRPQLETLRQATAYAAELGDAAAQAQTAHWRGWIHYVLGEYGDAIDASRGALALAEEIGDKKLLAQLWSSLGQSHAAACEYPEALDCLTRGLELKRGRGGRSGHSVAQGFAYALGCKANMHADLGEFELAVPDIDEALAAVNATGHAIEGSVLALQCMVQIYRGEWEACVESAARCCKVAERVNSAYVFAMGSVFDAYARFMLEPLPSALHDMGQAVEWLEARETGLFSSFNYGLFAEALAAAGQVARARDYALRALLRAQRRDPLGATIAYRVLARLQARAGSDGLRQVDELVGKAFASAQARGSVRDTVVTRLLLAELRAQAGACDEARGVASQALVELERMGMHWHAQRARAVLDPR